MQWFYIHVATLDSEAFVDAEPVDRATWLMLMRYCIGQENLGKIAGARSWGDRKWQQACKVTLKEVSRECRLWRWDGDDLCVEFYPVSKQLEREAKAEAGRKTAMKRWGDKQGGQQPPEQGSSTDSSATSTATPEQDAEGKVREGKVNPPNPPRGANGRESRIPCSKTHTDEEVMAWASHWLGEPASGTPPVPHDYVVHWLARANERSRVMANWQRALVSAWRRDWRTWTANAAAGAPGLLAPSRPVSPELRRLDLTRQLDAVSAAIERSPANPSSPWNSASASDEDRENLAKLRARKKELSAALLEASL